MQVIKRVLPLVLISLGLLAGYYLMNQRQDKRSSAAAESPSLLILPSEITNKPVNEEFTVRASVLTPTTHRITGYDLTLKFDPAVLEFVRYEVPLATDVGGGNVFHLPDPTDPTDNIFNMPLDPAAPRFYDNSAGTVRIMDALSNGSKGGTVYLQKLVFKVKQVTPTKLTFPTGVTANCGGMATMMTNQGVDMDAPVCVNYTPENQLTVNPAAATVTSAPPATNTPVPAATATPTLPPSVSEIVMQASDMTLSNYTATDLDDFCSADDMLPHIKLTGNVTGSASKVFVGAAGNYNVKVVYYDESDGASPVSFKVDGVTKFNWTMNQYTNTTETGNASCVANNGNLKEFVGTAPVALNSSSIISLTATYNGGEFARIAKIVFTPALGLDPGNTGARECQEGLPAKTLGNASNPDPHDSTLIECNGTIDIGDFETWRHEAVDLGAATSRETKNDWLADFNQDQIVDLLDFQIWNNSYGIRPTSTPPL